MFTAPASLSRESLQQEFASLRPVAGVRVGSAGAGIKYQNRDDILLLEMAPDAQLAAVFTQNAFCAAPVVVARRHVAAATTRYLLVNAGNANAGTGASGIDNAEACCKALGELTQCHPEQVLPFSTGVIGEHLPVDKITAALPTAIRRLQDNDWQAAASAIMTTDTLPKGISRSLMIDGKQVTISGIAKGAGMICPNMATLLSFVACDAALSRPVLQRLLQQVVGETFNRISVDGDTSTNDACVLVASGASGLPLIDSEEHAHYQALLQSVTEVFAFLARAVIRDAEGATKLVNVTVYQGRDVAECNAVAYTIAHSPLVKTALFAGDPNWGRILAAVGRAGINPLDIGRVNIDLNGVRIVSAGGRDAGYTEAQGQQAMARDDIAIDIYLGRGEASANVWTCDLSYDYVKINAEYRT